MTATAQLKTNPRKQSLIDAIAAAKQAGAAQSLAQTGTYTRAVPGATRAAGAATERATGAGLTLLPQLGTKRKAGRFIPLISGAICVAIAAGQLMLSVMSSSDAYELRSLQAAERDLNRVEQVLLQNVESLNSPQNLSDNARALGMVQNSAPAYLRLSDGAILGSIEAAKGAASANSVPNATLQNLPLADASGKTVTRELQQTAALPATNGKRPVVWEGDLPAPQTR
ncbi:MAG: hypothetical protein Q4C71_02465 [Microbacteriaceae bacterium]|nr:hypothetical protein [Microbacteriaceae bacterium]